MSSQPDTPPLPSDLPGLQNLIAQLNDDLVLQRTIYDSLKDLPPDLETESQLDEARSEFRRIQRHLSAARRAEYQLQRTANPPTQKMHPKQSRASSLGFAAGSAHSSSSPSPPGVSARSTAAGTMGPALSRPATPSRKRTYSHANVTPAKSGRLENKSRRGNPIPAADPFSSPAAALSSDRDDMSVIDLTGDDDDVYKRLEEEERRYERNKQLADRDATIARQLHDEGFSLVPSSSAHTDQSSQNGHPGPNYFDRMLPHRSHTTPGQAAQTFSGSQGGQYGGTVRDIPQRPSPQTVALSSSNRAHPSPMASHSRHNAPHMPGSFVDSDEDDGGLFHGPKPNPGMPASWHSPMSFPSTSASVDAAHLGSSAGDRYGTAAAAARQAALTRTYGVPSQTLPSGSSGYVPSWPYQPQSQTNASYFPFDNPFDRPGYLNMGSGNPLQVPSYRIAPGHSVYKTENSDTGDGLSSIIKRTNGFDYGNMTDANGNPLNDRLTNYIYDVMDDPRKTSEEIHTLLSNIRPDMELPVEERGETPEALKYPLYTHQQLALKWMTDMEEGTNKGGILADDMGLGKTISTLSLMATRKSTTAIKTNLIVGPVALIKQWEAEIRKKLKPEHRLSVVLFHQKKLQYSEMKAYDVVLTTYGKLAQEYKRYVKHLEARKDSAQYDVHDDLVLQRQCPLIHPRSKFYRVILDEAQCIKNNRGQASLACSQVSAQYRWCLTGTPMMNGVQELYALIRFLKIRPYNELSKFTQAFGSLTAKRYTSERARDRSMQQLRIVLKAIMLRRMKNSKIDGKPILTLPPKTETIQNCVFSEDEHSFYQQLESKSQVIFNKYLRAGTVGKNYSHVLVLLLRLRQACCHPHLNMDVEYATATAGVSTNTMEEFAKGLDDAVVARLKAAEGFDCPICFDVVADPTIFIPCGHDTCAECFTALTENSIQANIRSGQEGGDVTAKCPECRAPVLPDKVITYSAFKKVHMPETISEAPTEEVDDDETASGSDTDTASETEEDSDDEVDKNGDLRDFIVPDDKDSEYEEDAPAAEEDDDDFPELDVMAGSKNSTKSAKKSKKTGKGKKGKRGKKYKGKGKAEEVKPHMLATLRLEASKNQEARRKYMRYLKKNWQPSAKTTKVCELLKEIEPTGEKTIVFSQFTALLDLLEIPLKHELGVKYARYDGGMSRAHRDEAIRQFVENPRVTVLLVSLRAGNAGLNLTVASHVIICDPFWNPFIEMQAVDRAHRIGQQLPVQVHRVLVKGNQAEEGAGGEGGPAANALAETVEDRIVKLQDQKRGLINAALDEGESKSLGRLSEQELRYLFGVSSR